MNEHQPPIAVRRKKPATVYGVHAALAVAQHRPEAIHRVLYDKARRMALGPLLKAAAAQRRPYREVSAAELQKISSSVHHEGVVVVCDPLELWSLEDAIAEAPEGEGLWIALDEVGNPHNLGAIIRSAAWFGVAGVIFPRSPKQAVLGAAAVRIAQGGAEVVPCVGVDDLPEALTQLKAAGVLIAAADQGSPHSIYERPLPQPLCFVMGNEVKGLSGAVRRACDRHVCIPGSGKVESLNVSVSLGILLAYAQGSDLS